MSNEIVLNQDEFISDIAQRAGFTKGDVKLIFDTIVKLFEEYARKGTVVKLRSLGKLYYQTIPARKGRNGEDLPPTTRVIFRLAENIRWADKPFRNTETEAQEAPIGKSDSPS